MSASPAAPRMASVRAGATTSPSECPTSPRGCSMVTPPSTRATPSPNACASTPSPMRSPSTSGNLALHGGSLEKRRELGEPVDDEVGLVAPDGALQVAPRPTAEMNGDKAGGAGGHDIEIEPVADTRDPRGARP